VIALAAALAGAPALAASSIPAADFASFAFDQHPGARLPFDTVLRGPGGTPVAFASLFGRVPVVLDFEYDRCTTLCGTVLDQVTAALQALPLAGERDYRLAAIDIDPAASTDDAVAFAHAHGADGPGMTVLTGAPETVGRLADAAGFPYARDAATGQFAHPAGIIVATPDGRIARYLPGLSWRPLDLRLALAEAAGGAIAAPADRLLLLCYCYNPATGQYDVAIARLLRLVGAATLVTLAALVWRVARRPAR
jgi:protein SCO1/2